MASSTNMISALGAGSGIDVKALAQGLVEAERAPQKERIDAKLNASQARISGYAALKYALSEFRSAVEKLNDASDFGAPKATSSQAAALGVAPGATARAGSFSLEVSQLAGPQRSVSQGFASASTSLNGGRALTLNLAVQGASPVTINVAANKDTPDGIVSAINAAGKGITAQLIRTGSGDLPFSIVVTGQDGAAKSFSLTGQAPVPQTYDSDSTPVNGGRAFSFALSVAGGPPASIQVAAGQDTPQGMVDAINAANLTDVTAALSPPANAGDPYTLTVSSAGQTQSFTLTRSVDGLRFASPTTSLSDAFASPSTALNGGNGFSLSVSVNGGSAQSVAVSTATPQGVVDALNAANPSLQAELVGTGSATQPYAIAVNGRDGTVKRLSIDGAAAGLAFRGALVEAADARLKIDGLPVTRPGNTVSDLIPDVTLSLNARTEGAARIDLNRDTQTVKQNIQGLVKAYNDLDLSLTILTDPKSEVEGLGGSLAGDALIRTIRNTVRGILSANSRTPGSELKAARDVGLAFDRNGKLTLDEARLDKALAGNHQDVVRIFSAGTNNKSLYNSDAAGVAGDLVVSLDRMTRGTGLIARQSESATRDVDKYKRQLTTLEDRMSSLLARYTKQFGDMETIVGSSKDVRSSLSSSFAGMMAAYKN